MPSSIACAVRSASTWAAGRRPRRPWRSWPRSSPSGAAAPAARCASAPRRDRVERGAGPTRAHGPRLSPRVLSTPNGGGFAPPWRRRQATVIQRYDQLARTANSCAEAGPGSVRLATMIDRRTREMADLRYRMPRAEAHLVYQHPSRRTPRCDGSGPDSGSPVVLAAGAGSRFGGGKLLAPAERSAAARPRPATRSRRRACPRRSRSIAPDSARIWLEAIAAANGARTVVNPAPEEGGVELGSDRPRPAASGAEGPRCRLARPGRPASHEPGDDQGAARRTEVP